MKYLTALWQAIMAFFAHLKKHEDVQQATERAKMQADAAKVETAKVETNRDRHDHDQAVRDTPQPEIDQRLDKWYRD